MATIIIRRLDEAIKKRLRIRAARRGVSMEEAAREILNAALRGGQPDRSNLGEIIHRRFAKIGGVELPKLKRDPMREPPDFGS